MHFHFIQVNLLYLLKFNFFWFLLIITNSNIKITTIAKNKNNKFHSFVEVCDFYNLIPFLAAFLCYANISAISIE